MYIRFLDGPDHDWERTFVEDFCGLEIKKYWFHREILTMKVLEKNLDKILEFLKDLEMTIDNQPKYGHRVTSWDDLVIAYQILGVLILQTGSFLPRNVKDIIMKTTIWEYDKKRGWDPNSVESRKFYFNDFREKIQNHKTGKDVNSFIMHLQ